MKRPRQTGISHQHPGAHPPFGRERADLTLDLAAPFDRLGKLIEDSARGRRPVCDCTRKTRAIIMLSLLGMRSARSSIASRMLTPMLVWPITRRNS